MYTLISIHQFIIVFDTHYVEIQACVAMRIGTTSPQPSDTFYAPKIYRNVVFDVVAVIKKCIQRINYVHLNA